MIVADRAGLLDEIVRLRDRLQRYERQRRVLAAVLGVTGLMPIDSATRNGRLKGFEKLWGVEDEQSTSTFPSFAEYHEAIWRKGQFAFNKLAQLRPDLSEQIRGSKLDPFYDDDVLPAFFEWVEANW